jgi:Heterokaryon incompatibility protein (HET)
MNSQTSPRLCVSCQSLQLSPKDFEPSYHAHGRSLFSRVPLADLQTSSSSCSLCRLFVRSLQVSGLPLGKSVTCSARIAGYNHETNRHFATLRIWADDNTHEGHLLPVQSQYQDGFLGRIIDPKGVDVDLLKRWLGKCMFEHAHHCVELSSFNLFHKHILQDFLVIDVLEQKLAYPKSAVRYVALSYVWGRKTMPKLTQQDLKKWLSTNGLAELIPQLPRTIQDAMRVTQLIGERYLWVDSLCVIQDNPAFKARLINKMNLVYENAYLTIFAAAGPDADSGLPGIQSWSRGTQQPTAFVSKDLCLVYPFEHSSLRDSVWASRGWTYVSIL